jgi:hypothetical protein
MGKCKRYTKLTSENLNRRCCFDFDVNEGLKLHQDLVVRRSCVPEKVGVNKKGVNKKYSHRKKLNKWK